MISGKNFVIFCSNFTIKSIRILSGHNDLKLMNNSRCLENANRTNLSALQKSHKNVCAAKYLKRASR